MIIAQISDTHIALDVPDARQRIQDFETVIEDINALGTPPDMIIHSGDIVQNGRPDEYTQAAAILSQARVPVYWMVGNKDNRMHMRESFSMDGLIVPNSNFIAYEINDFPIRIVILDTKHSSSNKGDFCQERLQNLLDIIDADNEKPIVMFMHHPPCEITVGPDLIHFESINAMAELRKALGHSGRVLSIFSGHVHRSTSGHVDDIPVTVSSAVATTLRRGEYPKHMQDRPVYYIHRFDEKLGFITETRIASGSQ